jgi:hypothetical protein
MTGVLSWVTRLLMVGAAGGVVSTTTASARVWLVALPALSVTVAVTA